MSSAGASKRPLRSSDDLTDIYLVGSAEVNISGAKLPSVRQVLRVFFYNTRAVKLDSRESARLVIREVDIFWRKARIPTRKECHCIDKVLALQNHWYSLAKNKSRQSNAQLMAEKQFIDELDDLFDIAHSNAFDLMKIDEDKAFLTSQREKGRPGCMMGADHILAEKENRKVARVEKEQQRKSKHYAEIAQQSGGYKEHTE